MLHQETCIQGKLFNGVFGQESFLAVKRRLHSGFGFLPTTPDGNTVTSVSLRPLDRTAVGCTQAERCSDTPPPPGDTCVSLLEVSICSLDLSLLQRKLICLDAPLSRRHSWSILSLKLQQQQKKNVLILFFSNHTIWCQNNLLSCVGNT